MDSMGKRANAYAIKNKIYKFLDYRMAFIDGPKKNEDTVNLKSSDVGTSIENKNERERERERERDCG